MVSLEVIAILLSGISISASLFYYANVLQNSNKTQKQQLETRQAQFFMSVYRDHVTKENISDWTEMVQEWKWTDYDDYWDKYGSVHESGVKFGSYINRLEGLGVLVKRGLIDANLLYDLNYGSIIMMWNKFLPIIAERRRQANAPHLYCDVEYLYDKIVKIREERGHPRIITRTLETKAI